MSEERGGSSPDSNWYVLLFGARRPPEPLVLAPGLTLRPLQEPISYFDLAGAGAAGFLEWSVLSAAVGGCTSEIETAQDAATTPGYDALNRAWLATALLVLRGYGNLMGVACSAYSWTQVAGIATRKSGTFKQQLAEEGIDAAVHNPWDTLPAFRGNLLDFHLHYLSPAEPPPHPVLAEDAKWVEDNFDRCNRLATDSDRFRIALEAAVDWRFDRDERTAVARLWTGIEALIAVSAELVYRISIISASLLEERGQARRERYKSIKRLYGLRSKAVHGEVMAKEALTRAVIESRDLLNDLIMYVIERGETPTEQDFERAILG